MASQDKSTTSVTRLLRLARQLSQDDAAVLADCATPARVLYAIDSSEVFSYVFLNRLQFITEDPQRSDFMLNVGFNEIVLQEILLSHRYSLFMLPSHRLEYRQLIETLHEQDVSELGRILPELQKKLILRKGLLSALSKFHSTVEGETIDAAIVREIVNEAARDAPNILLLARSEHVKPSKRFTELRGRLRLETLATLAPTLDVSVDPSLVGEAFDEFSRRRPNRPEAANRVDAYGLAYLVRLTELAPTDIAFRFVTRSQVFQDVCNVLHARELITKEAAQSVRHPRAFSAYVLANATNKTPIEFVRQRLQSAETFLSARGGLSSLADAEIATSSAPSIDQSASVLRHTLADIERIAILSTISGEANLGAEGRPAKSHTDIDKLVALLKDDAAVRRAVQDRAQEVVNKLSAGTLAIARSIAASVAGDQAVVSALEPRIIPKNVTIAGRVASVVTVAQRHSSPAAFNILFYSDYLSKRKERGEPLQAALSSFISATDLDAPYERRLATAYYLGISGDWNLALQFVNVALEDPTIFDETPRHEGYYLRAIARRVHLDWDEQNIVASIHDVRKAQAIRSKTLEPGEEDLRFLNELAMRIDQGTTIGLSKAELGSEAEPTDLWKRILLGNVDRSYKLNAANNLTFYYTNKRDKLNAKQSLGTLEEMLRGDDLNFEHLPPSVRDTMLRARLFTGIYSTRTEIYRANVELRKLKNDSYVKKRPVIGNSR